MKRAGGVALGGIALLVLVGVGVMGAGMIDNGNGTDGSGASTPTPSATQTGPSVSTPPPSQSPETPSAAASFEIDALDGATDVAAGEEILLTAVVENVGDARGSQEITLARNDTDSRGSGDAETVALEPGGSETVALGWTATEPGTYELAVTTANDSATTAVKVLEASPNFEVTIVGTNAPVEDRAPLTVTADLTNRGAVNSTQTVNLSAGDDRLAATSVTLDGGASTTTNLTWEPATPHGEHNLTVATANDTATTTAVIEPIEEPAVAGRVSVMTEDVIAEGGTVSLYGAESDEQLDSADLGPNGTFRFADLEPGEQYRLEVPNAVATHPEIDEEIGGPEAFPTRTYTFTAEEVQQSADLTYGYEIRGADSYRWEFHKEYFDTNYFEGHGRYDSGEAYVRENQRTGVEELEPIVRQTIYLDNTTYFNTSKQAPVWQVDADVTWHHPSTVPHKIVQDPLGNFIRKNREYDGTTRIDGTDVHVYDVSFLPEYPGATVYINPSSGYIIRWEAHDHHRRGPDGYLYDYPAEIIFMNHNDESISVDPPK